MKKIVPYVAVAAVCLILAFAITSCALHEYGTALTKAAATRRAPDVPPKSALLVTGTPVLVGAAHEEITPDRPVMMGGYGVTLFSRQCARWSKGVHDPLYATALYIAKGPEELVIVHADAVGLVWTDQWAIRRDIARRLGIPIRNVISAASHTHHGPDTIGIWGPIVPSATGRDEHYIQDLVRTAGDAAVEAYLSRRPATLAYATGEVKVLHRNTYLDQIPDPYIDDGLSVLIARDTHGEAIVTLANWACHPTTQSGANHLISSDWVGGYYASLAGRNLGLPMFVNASIGASIQPDGAWFRHEFPDLDSESFTYTEKMGERFADAVTELAANAQPLNFDTIRVDERAPKARMMNHLYALAVKQGLMPVGLPPLGEMYATKVTSVEMGPVRIGTMPGEMSPQLGLQIREALGGQATFLIGLSQDYLGYILDPDQYDNPMYQYEHMLCLGPDLGEAVVSAHYEMRVARENANTE